MSQREDEMTKKELLVHIQSSFSQHTHKSDAVGYTVKSNFFVSLSIRLRSDEVDMCGMKVARDTASAEVNV